MPRHLWQGIGIAVLAALTACAPAPVEKPVRAPVLPSRTVSGAVHYRVVQTGTLVYARVFRGGRLARLGHNHIVELRRVRGDIFLADDVGRSVFDLAVAPADAVVDPPALRATQGDEFQTTVSENARSATRRNMLGPDVLHASRFPYVKISSTRIDGPLASARATVDLTLKGVTRRLTIPVSVHVEDGRLTAKGRFEILQSDFGIQPYSVLGGALKVKDRVTVVFDIAAEKVG
ncbi:MAG: YceI family protein [Arenicellales bacterium]